VEVVEVDHVVLDELHPVDQVANDVGVRRDGDVERILDRSARRDGMHHRADPADSLDVRPRVARIAVLHDDLDAAKLGGCRPRIGDPPVFRLRFDAKVPLDP